MKKLIITSMTMAAFVGLTAQAQMSGSQGQGQIQGQGQPQSSQQDSSFITKAAQGNLAEVQMGQLASQKSQNNQVKEFAQHLQQDHQQANQKLQTIAQSKGMQFPRSADSKSQQQISQLQKLSGADFDKQFATQALQSHAQTIALFQKEAQQGQDPATKQYAQNLLPALQHHLTMAKNLAGNVGVSQTTVSSILQQYPQAMGGAGSATGQQQGTGSGQSGQQDHQHMHDMQQ